MNAEDLEGMDVVIKTGIAKGTTAKVEDSFKGKTGKSWRECHDSIVCTKYAMRVAVNEALPNDDDVVIVLGNLYHVSELEPVE